MHFKRRKTKTNPICIDLVRTISIDVKSILSRQMEMTMRTNNRTDIDTIHLVWSFIFFSLLSCRYSTALCRSNIFVCKSIVPKGNNKFYVVRNTLKTLRRPFYGGLHSIKYVYVV